MWKFVYNLALHCALPFFILFGLLNRKVRKNMAERFLPRRTGEAYSDYVWIHAASLGEAVIAQNLVEQMIPKAPCEPRFLITTNTYYTRDLLTGKMGDRATVRSLPFDLPFSLNRFMDRADFRGLILIETEIWPNLIWKAFRRGIPVIIVNGRISDNTIGKYRRLSPLLSRVLPCLRLVLAQSEVHARRFIELGMDPRRVVNAGNLKYYRNIPACSTRPDTYDIITFGSIKEREVEPVLAVAVKLKRQFPRLLPFIVPRELRLVNTIEEALRGQLTTVRYSSLKNGGMDCRSFDSVVVDTVGDLLSIYGQSQVAFVGGSLAPYGGQNMLEPLFFETPVLFGPHVDNFKEVADQIVSAGGGMVVADGDDLFRGMAFLLSNEEQRVRMGKAGRGVIDAQNRVMLETVSHIGEVLWKNDSPTS